MPTIETQSKRSTVPEPLAEGAVLQGRFTIASVLGQGAFTTAYLANDQRRKDLCVVLELAPMGSRRTQGRHLSLEVFGDGHAMRLRQLYQDEHRAVSTLNARALRGGRNQFCENGTAYAVVEHVAGAKPLSERMASQVKLDFRAVSEMLLELATALRMAHLKGLLHLDIRPENVLVTDAGRHYLIGFGAARAWHEEATGCPIGTSREGFRAAEMAESRLRRGPATDLYALCATAYAALAGGPPLDPVSRQKGGTLVPLRAIRPDLPLPLSKAIEAGLALDYAGRPRSADDLLELLHSEAIAEDADEALDSFDEKAVRLMSFRYQRRECMSCGGILESVRPLRRLVCPVCHEGTVRQRSVLAGLCPICRAAPLKKRPNQSPISICPVCKTGLLSKHRHGLLSKVFDYRCMECEAVFAPRGDLLARVVPDEEMDGGWREVEYRTEQEWLADSGRSSEVQLCDGCGAQFDVNADGRWSLRLPERASRYAELYPQEWCRVANGLPPFAGNAECDSCGADFELDALRMTLLAASQDPYGYSERFSGRPVLIEDVRFLGVGKHTQNPGCVCLDCGTEFDEESGHLRLIQSSFAPLVPEIGRLHSLEDWNRIARRIPLKGEEGAFEADFDKALVKAYRTGGVVAKRKGERELIWRSPAQVFEVADTEWKPLFRAKLEVYSSEMTYGGLLRRKRFPLEAIQSVECRESRLRLTVYGEANPMGIEVSPMRFESKLQSGKRSVELSAGDLAARLRWQLGLGEAG